MLRFPVTGALLLLLLAACGNGDDEARVVPTSPADSPATSPAATRTDEPEPAPPITATETPTPAATGDINDVSMRLQPVLEGLRNPLQILPIPGGNGLVVVEQSGRVRRLAGGELTTVLDIEDQVVFQGEQGLLAVAFHPEYPSDPRMFLHYSGAPDGRTVVSSIPVEDGVAEASAEQVLLEVEQPAPNHNGGMLVFGPDGRLYLGLGDGGGANDQFGNGQDPDTLLGTISIVDPDQGGASVWHYGLRNPWRFTFDEGLLYVADVGQSQVEEISAVDSSAEGLNFGWPILEGSRCFQAADCDRSGLVPPVIEYTHDETGGCSVIGGPVYRGEALPGLRGHYLYGDLCAGFLRSARITGSGATEERDWTEQVGDIGGILGFGTDHAGEVYLGFQDGRVAKLVPAP